MSKLFWVLIPLKPLAEFLQGCKSEPEEKLLSTSEKFQEFNT